MSSSHQGSAPAVISSPSSCKRRVSLGTLETSTSTVEESQYHPHQEVYRSSQLDDTRGSVPYSSEYHHRDQRSSSNLFHPNVSVTTTKNGKRYPGNVVIPPHQDGCGEYHHYRNRAYSGEGKENLPSPPVFPCADGENQQYQHYHNKTIGYEDSSSYNSSFQQGSHAPPHRHIESRPSYSNDQGEWYHSNYEGYYNQGPPPAHLYHSSSNSAVDSRAYGDYGDYYPSSSDGRDSRTSLSFVDHTYRDFSGVPPTDEDRERYNNKKTEYNRRVKEQKAETKNPGSNKGEAESSSNNRVLKKRRGRGNRATKSGTGFIGFMGTNFPARLHDLLSHEEEISAIITWLPHGRSWIVRDKSEFLKKVAPSHFQISKFESFTRQVNGWGFKRITQGPDINSYYHELFLRGMPHLIQWMKRSTSSGPGRRKIRADPKDEPDFYSISQMYPIPNYYSANGQQIVHAPPLDGPADKNNSSNGEDIVSIKNENNELRHEHIPSPIRPSKRLKTTNTEKRNNQNKKRANILFSSSSSPPPYPKEYRGVPHNSSNVPSSGAWSHNGLHQGRDANFNAPGANNRGLLHSPGDMYTNHAPAPPLRSNKEVVTQVKNFWTDNLDSTNDSHFHPHQHPNHPTSSTQHRHYESYDDSQYDADFKPSEGTIGDREAFRWDDADYVRERHTNKGYSNNNCHHQIINKSNQTINVDYANNNTSEQDYGYPGSCSAIVSDDTNDSNVRAFLQRSSSYQPGEDTSSKSFIQNYHQRHQREQDSSDTADRGGIKHQIRKQDNNSSDVDKSSKRVDAGSPGRKTNSVPRHPAATSSLSFGASKASPPLKTTNEDDQYREIVACEMPESTTWALI